MRAVLIAAIMASTTLTTAQADTVSSSKGREDLAITIYNDGLALVRDSRFINLPAAGRSTLAFEDVSGQMMPQTAALSGAMTVIEQNFDFDLLSPQALLNKAVGEEVLLYREDSDGDMEARDAIVLSNNGGAAVLKVGNQIEIIQSDFPGRIVFKKIPANLKVRPTLSMEIDAKRAGDQKIELAYLTNGIGWSADYVGKLSRDEKTLDLTGLITLTNNTGVSYTKAKTQLIAGDLNRAREELQYERSDMVMMTASKRSSAPVAREAVGDYHMYTLPQPTTIANKQTKQVTFLTAGAVPVQKVYSYDAIWFYTQKDPQNASVSLEFENEAKSNLGLPLPKGVVRIYGKDSAGNAQFLGEDRIGHTAEGNDVDLTMGKAFDVTVTSKKRSDDLVSKTRTREIRDITMEYVIKNAKESDVVVTLTQRVGRDVEVLDTNITAKEEDAQTLSFDVAVPSKGETKLRFKVRAG